MWSQRLDAGRQSGDLVAGWTMQKAMRRTQLSVQPRGRTKARTHSRRDPQESHALQCDRSSARAPRQERRKKPPLACTRRCNTCLAPLVVPGPGPLTPAPHGTRILSGAMREPEIPKCPSLVRSFCMYRAGLPEADFRHPPRRTALAARPFQPAYSSAARRPCGSRYSLRGQ